MIIGLRVEGLKEYEARLAKIHKMASDFTPAFKDMKVKIISLFKENFDVQGTIVGSKWKPRKRSYSWPILNRTGKLKNTWKDNVQKLKLEIENPVSYAGYHQFGTRVLPVRALIGVSKNIKDVIIEAVTKYIKSSLK